MTDLRHAADTRPYLLEQIDDAAVVQLYADGFAALPRGREDSRLAPVLRRDRGP